MSIRLHTPGPCTVDYSDDNLRIYAGDLLIGEVNGSTEHIEVRGLDEETTQANAWLIAAAPDLLAALERILARALRCSICSSNAARTPRWSSRRARRSARRPTDEMRLVLN